MHSFHVTLRGCTKCFCRQPLACRLLELARKCLERWKNENILRSEEMKTEILRRTATCYIWQKQFTQSHHPLNIIPTVKLKGGSITKTKTEAKHEHIPPCRNNVSAPTAHWHLTHCQINTGNDLNVYVVEPEPWHTCVPLTICGKIRR